MPAANQQQFASVWDAIEDTPQAAANLRIRSGLMMSLSEAIKVQGLTQVQAAALFGVTQPRISDLARGKVPLFSLDALVNMATTAGMAPSITVTMPKKSKAKTATGKAPTTSQRAARKNKTAQLPAA